MCVCGLKGDHEVVATIVFVHAHPDDEASQTSGSMARAAAEGHRVVVVFATGGEHGEVPDDLQPGETLVDRRRREAEAAAAVVGTARVGWLGYADSGMSGWEQNSHENSFAGADLDEAATRLATILDEEEPDVLVGYDWHGGYGHPDHVKVHHVVHRAAELARRRPRVLESTMNRDLMRRLLEQARAAGEAPEDWDIDAAGDDGNPIGTSEAEITYQVDVRDYVPQRRAALAAHASQATDIQAFLSMPEDAFAAAFGFDHFIEPGAEPGMRRGWILD